MTWLAQTESDPMISDDARALARIMVEGFRADAGDYINGHDAQFAEVLNVSVRAVAEARRELISHGHLIPLSGRMGVPSFKLSTCRW